MTNSKRITITTESREIYIMRISGESNLRVFCANCAEPVELLTIDEAVSVSARRARELFARIESNAIHSIETASGHLLICRRSLIEKTQ